MSRYPARDNTSRTGGPSVLAPGDGLEGAYSATLHSVPSGGTCKVVIPALSLTQPYTAVCSKGFTGNVGDGVLVMFDESKQPWVISPSAVTLQRSVPARAYRNAAATATAGSWVKVPLDTVSFDPDNGFSLTNGVYNVPKAGYYLCSGQVAFQATTAGQGGSAGLGVGTPTVTQVAAGAYTTSEASGLLYVTVCDVVYVPAGGFIELQMFATANLALVSSSSSVNYLTVMQVN